MFKCMGTVPYYTQAYFMRALRFAWPNWHLICVAMVCLSANAGSALALPNFQGEILDNVFPSAPRIAAHTSNSQI